MNSAGSQKDRVEQTASFLELKIELARASNVSSHTMPHDHEHHGRPPRILLATEYPVEQATR